MSTGHGQWSREQVAAAEEPARALYREKGFQARVGFGERPALLIIDLTVSWCDPTSRLGADHTQVIGATKSLLGPAREAGIPVVFTRIAYDQDLKDAGLWLKKIPALADARIGDPGGEIHPELAPLDGELVLTKKYSSAFFGTPLMSYLTTRAVDTVIVTGCSTSACVRHTTVDALGYGFRPILPAECIGDRAAGPHSWNLFDMDAKFGDVVPLEEVLRYVASAGAEKGESAARR